MGSGVLLAALVVLWFVVLVPMVVTRGDAAPARAGATGAGRTLQRRRVVDPVVHAETERVAIDRAALRSSGELHVDVHAVRRRTLAGRISAGDDHELDTVGDDLDPERAAIALATVETILDGGR